MSDVHGAHWERLQAHSLVSKGLSWEFLPLRILQATLCERLQAELFTSKVLGTEGGGLQEGGGGNPCL